MSLLLYALGGRSIPDVLLRSALSPQRRWSTDGEIELTNPTSFGFSDEVRYLFADEKRLAESLASPAIIRDSLDDGSITWSLQSELFTSITESLVPEVKAELGIVALKVICFASPPCYSGNTDWYVLF